MGDEPGRVDPVAAGDVLGRAMSDDPGWVYVFPDPASRTRKLSRLFELVIRRHFARLGACHAAGGAVAIWAPPGRHDLGLATALALAPRLGWLVGRRVVPAVRLFREMERRSPREPHYYLAALGVAPEQQGRGKGVEILRPVLARCDATRTLAWLESANPKNHSFYRRLGFERADELALPGGPTVTWFARRPW